jgi:predicted  nucleic acid-binding Zn-ribbon protein
MATLTFETLKYTERLRAAGVPESQAKAEAEALRDVLAEATDTALATKTDISRLETKIETMELRLTIKLGAFLAMAVGVIITALKAF